jgi:hypothetical protein
MVLYSVLLLFCVAEAVICYTTKEPRRQTRQEYTNTTNPPKKPQTPQKKLTAKKPKLRYKKLKIPKKTVVAVVENKNNTDNGTAQGSSEATKSMLTAKRAKPQ